MKKYILKFCLWYLKKYAGFDYEPMELNIGKDGFYLRGGKLIPK